MFLELSQPSLSFWGAQPDFSFVSQVDPLNCRKTLNWDSRWHSINPHSISCWAWKELEAKVCALGVRKWCRWGAIHSVLSLIWMRSHVCSGREPVTGINAPALRTVLSLQCFSVFRAVSLKALSSVVWCVTVAFQLFSVTITQICIV